jgi:hypothetical protein
MCVSYIVHLTILKLARTDLSIFLARYGVIPHACGTSCLRTCLTPTRLMTRLVIEGRGEVDSSIRNHAAKLLAEVRSGISRNSMTPYVD